MKTHWKLALIAALLALPLMAEEAGVAAALGVRSPTVAAAVESGAGEKWRLESKESAVQNMDAERSFFLRNAPRYSSQEPEAASTEAKIERPMKKAAERERDLALQQLEFRRNVEDAMKKILSFSPSARSGPPSNVREVGEQPPAPVADPSLLTPRERLIFAGVGGDYRPQAPASRPAPVPAIRLPDEDRRMPRLPSEDEVIYEPAPERPVREIAAEGEASEVHHGR